MVATSERSSLTLQIWAKHPSVCFNNALIETKVHPVQPDFLVLWSYFSVVYLQGRKWLLLTFDFSVSSTAVNKRKDQDQLRGSAC